MPNKMSVTLMLSCVGGATSAILLQQLRQNGIFEYRLIGIDSQGPGRSSAQLDAFHIVPNGSDSDYLDRLLEIVDKEKVEFILPGSDEEALAMARGREQLLHAGARPMISSDETLALIADKAATYKCLAEQGIAVPEYTLVEDVDALSAATQDYGYPQRTVVCKPASGRGGRGLHILVGQDGPADWLGAGKREKRIELQEYGEKAMGNMVQGPTLVMPSMQAPAYDADIVAQEGNASLIVVRQRMNPAGIPFEGNRIMANSEVQEYCRTVAKALGLDAVHDVDLMTDVDGAVQVLEVNPRPSGSMAASLVAGFNVVDVAIGKLLDYPVEQAEASDELLVFPRNGSMVVERQ